MNSEETQYFDSLLELPLIIGRSYFLNTNISLQYGLVNGAELKLKQICGKQECNETKNTQILLNSPGYLIMELKYNKFNNNSLF
jgi:hypothetical protein